ncbi:hypothetical protein VNO77_42071 [Canavalia gladiata]|uniref:Uncharacterized protein n=1 Tax=Canavalia gladiata TaxID=3824 RepID=A0AAN9PQP3_CANGL
MEMWCKRGSNLRPKSPTAPLLPLSQRPCCMDFLSLLPDHLAAVSPFLPKYLWAGFTNLIVHMTRLGLNVMHAGTEVGGVVNTQPHEPCLVYSSQWSGCTFCGGVLTSPKVVSPIFIDLAQDVHRFSSYRSQSSGISTGSTTSSMSNSSKAVIPLNFRSHSNRSSSWKLGTACIEEIGARFPIVQEPEEPTLRIP